MWFPTIAGLAVVDARNFRWNTTPPSVVIEHVLADGQAMDLQKDVIVPPGPRDLEIHYTELSYVVPEQVRFKYKLDGYDKAWQEVGTRRVAYYTNVPPGRYTFRVQAANNHRVWSQEGAVLSVSLAPYFYETLWF